MQNDVQKYTAGTSRISGADKSCSNRSRLAQIQMGPEVAIGHLPKHLHCNDREIHGPAEFDVL